MNRKYVFWLRSDVCVFFAEERASIIIAYRIGNAIIYDRMVGNLNGRFHDKTAGGLSFRKLQLRACLYRGGANLHWGFCNKLRNNFIGLEISYRRLVGDFAHTHPPLWRKC